MSIHELVSYTDAWLAADAAQMPQPPAQPKPVYMGLYTTRPLAPMSYAGDVVIQVNSWETDQSRWSLDEERKVPMIEYLRESGPRAALRKIWQEVVGVCCGGV